MRGLSSRFIEETGIGIASLQCDREGGNGRRRRMTDTTCVYSERYQSFLNHYTAFEADKALAQADQALLDAVELMHEINGHDADATEVLAHVLDALSQIGKKTWWFCACGEISPVEGNVDAYCEQCKTWRKLPERLSFPVWTAWVMAAKLLAPKTWFERLERWSQANGLLRGEAECEETNVGRCGDRDESNDLQTNSVPAPAEGVAANVQDEAKARACSVHRRVGGDVPLKCLSFIDGMHIFEDGRTCGTNWIALPVPGAAILI